MNQLLRVGEYARVSSQKQADELTIQSQLDEMHQRIATDGLEVGKGLCFCDDGYSGKTLLRPALESLRDHVFSGLIDRLYVHSPDRLARNYAWQFLLLDEFRRCSCEVIFLNDRSNDNSPESIMLLQMQGTIAEYERAKILERTRRGRRFAAKQGKVSAIAHAPYGYRYVTKYRGDGEARWEIDPEQSEHVRHIFHWVCGEGLSLHAVCRRLESMQVKTAKGNDRWNTATVRGILINSAYHGTAMYGKTQLSPRMGRRPKRGDPAIPRQELVSRETPVDQQTPICVPAIITRELFDVAAERMQENRLRQRARQEGTVNLLSGLLICGCCGSSYCGYRPRGYFYYRCIGADKFRNPGKSLCQNKSVKGEALDNLVWCDLYALLRDPSRIRTELERRKEPDVDSSSVSRVTKAIQDLQTRINRLIDAYTDGALTVDEFKSRVERLRNRLQREEETLESLKRDHGESQNIEAMISLLDRFSADVLAQLNAADDSKKRELIKLLVKRIEITSDEVRIVYRVPLKAEPASIPSNKFLQHQLRFPEKPPA